MCATRVKKGKTFENFEQKYTEKGAASCVPLSHA